MEVYRITALPVTDEHGARWRAETCTTCFVPASSRPRSARRLMPRKHSAAFVCWYWTSTAS